MKILINNDEYKINEKKSLSQIFIDLGLPFSMPCGGNKRCGGCVVKAFGDLSEPTEFEREKLGSRLIDGMRLACDTIVTGDCTVVFEESIKGELYAPNVKHEISYLESEYVGVADIGTTTIAAQLYKMPQGELIASKLEKNAQCVLGGDVISRLTYSIKNGAQRANELICQQIDNIFDSFPFAASKIYLTGNSAMLSFFANAPINGLAAAPFKLIDSFGRWKDKYYLLPCISPFVGADALCGVFAAKMDSLDKAMLIDIGTNTEIIYKNGENYICASAAAGPCFEGAGIKMGMISAPGAVDKVFSVGNVFEYTTAYGKSPVGICGSGLIDLVSSLLTSGILERDGYLHSPFTLPNSSVTVYQEDIRAVQTAKSAIISAINTVCDNLNEVEKVFISGGFGSSINIGNAINIGLLPHCFEKKVEFIGNSALKGAVMMMFDSSLIDISKEIAKKCNTVDLTASEKFNKSFILNMNF